MELCIFKYPSQPVKSIHMPRIGLEGHGVNSNSQLLCFRRNPKCLPALGTAESLTQVRPEVALVPPPFLLPPTCLLGSTGCDAHTVRASGIPPPWPHSLLTTAHPGTRGCHQHIFQPTFHVKMSQVLPGLGVFILPADEFHKNFLCFYEKLQSTAPTCVHPALAPSWTKNQHSGVAMVV